MQINYPSWYEKDRSIHAPMWWAPNPDNTLRDMMIPPVYAPFGTPQFWPNATVQSAAFAQDWTFTTPPAPTPSAASMPAVSLSPVSLVSPVPSITPVPSAQVSSAQASIPASSGWCGVESWVNNNPGMAAIAAIALFFVVKGMK